MSLNIYELHADPSKLKGYGNDMISLYHWLDKFLNQHAMPELKEQAKYINNKSSIERIIASGDAEDSYNYAKHILNGPFKLGEKAISKSAGSSYNYAHHILNGPFKLGEKAIATDAHYSFMYAHDVLGDRFEMGEEVIKKDAWHWNNYQEAILSPIGQKNLAWGKS